MLKVKLAQLLKEIKQKIENNEIRGITEIIPHVYKVLTNKTWIQIGNSTQNKSHVKKFSPPFHLFEFFT